MGVDDSTCTLSVLVTASIQSWCWSLCTKLMYNQTCSLMEPSPSNVRLPGSGALRCSVFDQLILPKVGTESQCLNLVKFSIHLMLVWVYASHISSVVRENQTKQARANLRNALSTNFAAYPCPKSVTPLRTNSCFNVRPLPSQYPLHLCVSAPSG